MVVGAMCLPPAPPKRLVWERCGGAVAVLALLPLPWVCGPTVGIVPEAPSTGPWPEGVWWEGAGLGPGELPCQLLAQFGWGHAPRAGRAVSGEVRGHRGAGCCCNRPASPHSYRRFCRLDDVSAQYWSRSWLASASSLDNPAFTHSEELLHLQVLDNGCCGCREAPAAGSGPKQRPAPPARPAHRPR